MRKLFGKSQDEAASSEIRIGEGAKVDIPLDKAQMFSPPASVVLVTSIASDGRPNILAVGMYTWISYVPPMLVIGVAPERYSYKLIEETQEFVVNSPPSSLMKKVAMLGKISGSNHDKFKELGLTPIPARIVKAPMVKECISNLECKVVGNLVCGDHKLYCGEVVAAHADSGIPRIETYVRKYPPY